MRICKLNEAINYYYHYMYSAHTALMRSASAALMYSVRTALMYSLNTALMYSLNTDCARTALDLKHKMQSTSCIILHNAQQKMHNEHLAICNNRHFMSPSLILCSEERNGCE